MQEFKVNEYIKLKLEEKQTILYLKDEKFRQCRSLILNIPLEGIPSLSKLRSIDEAADALGRVEDGQQGVDYIIDPETEFWAHCSNLQAWYENDYNMGLIHSNLAFPLLKKLTEADDPLARRVFKEEI